MHIEKFTCSNGLVYYIATAYDINAVGYGETPKEASDNLKEQCWLEDDEPVWEATSFHDMYTH